MTGPEHYRAAELLLDEVTGIEGREDRIEHLATAQVHATLALAAATAQNIRRNGAADVDIRGWNEALS